MKYQSFLISSSFCSFHSNPSCSAVFSPLAEKFAQGKIDCFPNIIKSIPRFSPLKQGTKRPPSLPIQDPCSRPNHVRKLRAIRNYTKVVKYTNYQLLHGFSSRKKALRFPTPQHFLLNKLSKIVHFSLC